MAKTIKLDTEVRAVLQRSEITAGARGTFTLQLPQQHDRALYLKVDMVLKAAGGKWNRGQGLHLFERDPREVLGMAVETGAIENEQQVRQTFYTPPEVAAMVMDAGKINESTLRVLEPSAGRGALVVAAINRGVIEVVAVENDPEGIKDLRGIEEDFQSRVRVVEGDFLKLATARGAGLGKFDAVVMNPPFAEAQEIAHVRAAFKLLREGGRLVAVMSKAVEFRETDPYKTFREEWLAERCASISPIPPRAFRSSGTDVETVIVTVPKLS